MLLLVSQRRGVVAAEEWVEGLVAWEFMAQLVEARYAHFHLDPLFPSMAGTAADRAEEHGRGDGRCPMGSGSDSTASGARMADLHAVAIKAVGIVHALPSDVRSLVVGNYVEEVAWSLLINARRKAGAGTNSRHGGGEIKRLVFLFRECF